MEKRGSVKVELTVSLVEVAGPRVKDLLADPDEETGAQPLLKVNATADYPVTAL